jgi:TolB-like protein/Tfp pilus assembly protein PilF
MMGEADRDLPGEGLESALPLEVSMVGGAAPDEPSVPTTERLDSWKAIAVYLKRGVRTVMRWEKEEGLPVRRHLHQKRGTVYAYRHEIDAWWHGRRARLESEPEAPETALPEGEAGDPRPSRRGRALGALALVAAVVGLGYLGWRRAVEEAPPPPGRIMLAVIPFDDLSGAEQQEYFSDGLTEEMLTELSRLQPERLGVIARTSVMQYKHTHKTAQQIGRELGVAYLLEGSVRREGERVRIAAQLIRTSDQTHLWAGSYGGALRDILTLQADVAREIAREIELKLTPAQQARLASWRAVNPEAYRLYLQGKHHVNKRTAEGFGKGIRYLEQAIEKDPSHARAYAELATIYAMLPFYGVLPPAQSYPRANELATRALEVEADLAEGHMVLAALLERWTWDSRGAEREFRRSIELNRNYATAHHWYGLFLERMGRLEEGRAEMARALDLDPASLIVNKNVGDADYFAGSFDRAIEQYQKTLDLDPDFYQARLFLGHALEQKGQIQAAIAEYEKARQADGDPAILAALAHAHARAGDVEKARAIVEDLRRSARYVSPYHFAIVYVGLRQPDQAFEWLEKAYAERSERLLYVKIDPQLQPLRSDPRYRDLIRRIGLL